MLLMVTLCRIVRRVPWGSGRPLGVCFREKDVWSYGRCEAERPKS